MAPREVVIQIMTVTGVLVWTAGVALVVCTIYGHWSHTRYWRSRQGLSKLNELRTKWAGKD